MTEIWYVVETSLTGADDWFAFTGETYDSVDGAVGAITRFIEAAQWRAREEHESEYRVVRKTLTSEVVGVASPKEGK